MDINRIIDKFDRLMKEDAFDEAEKHLLYWLDDARASGDKRGQFSILNEMTGFYRMLGRHEDAFRICDKLLEVMEELKLGEDDTSRATAFLNIATVYSRFDKPEKAVGLYSKALSIYKEVLPKDDFRLAALYNNMALAVMNIVSENNGNSFKDCVFNVFSDYICENDIERQDLKQTDCLNIAERLFMKALDILEKNIDSENEQAMTYLNLADLEEKKSGPEAGEERILEFVETASMLLDKSYNQKNPDFVQTAEKCYHAFKKYGRFAYANELAERIKKLKENTI